VGLEGEGADLRRYWVVLTTEARALAPARCLNTGPRLRAEIRLRRSSPLGVFLAALVTRALQEFDVRFSIPWGQLVFFALIAVIVGVLAAIMPARRAAKLNVLRELQSE
jgi:hypothetical protein